VGGAWGGAAAAGGAWAVAAVGGAWGGEAAEGGAWAVAAVGGVGGGVVVDGAEAVVEEGALSEPTTVGVQRQQGKRSFSCSLLMKSSLGPRLQFEHAAQDRSPPQSASVLARIFGIPELTPPPSSSSLLPCRSKQVPARPPKRPGDRRDHPCSRTLAQFTPAGALALQNISLRMIEHVRTAGWHHIAVA
jgi:hypothetical protein